MSFWLEVKDVRTDLWGRDQPLLYLLGCFKEGGGVQQSRGHSRPGEYELWEGLRYPEILESEKGYL